MQILWQATTFKPLWSLSGPKYSRQLHANKNAVREVRVTAPVSSRAQAAAESARQAAKLPAGDFGFRS